MEFLKNSRRICIVEKHKLCFDITQILSVVLDFFQQYMGSCCNLYSCFQ